eukprot:c20664_g1_i1.p1 GENE.c20664_g1_i1~~c20664_g1_i1.p1  ORF type:complete len:344 (+),score=53.17 c20664_g1_i1:64-1032(+)
MSCASPDPIPNTFMIAPKDVWIHHIGPQLETRDIIALSMTCRWCFQVAHEITHARDVFMMSDKSPDLCILRHVLRKWPNIDVELFFQDNRKIVSETQFEMNLLLLGRVHSAMVCGCKRLSNFDFVSPNLKKLHLPGSKLDMGACQKLASFLTTNSTLTVLDMSDNNIGDFAAQVIAEAMAHNRGISLLNLGGNAISKRAVSSIALSLKSNTTLTTLHLWSNDIGDEGGVALADALRVNSTLLILNLWRNRVGDDGGRELASVLVTNHTLTSMNIANNPISFELRQQIHAQVSCNKLRVGRTSTSTPISTLPSWGFLTNRSIG